MKNFYYLALFILSFLLLTACQQEDEVNTNEEVMEENNEEVEEKANPNEGKPTKSKEEIEEAALYRWQVDEAIEIVLTKEDGEISRHEVTSALGEEGDEYFAGNAAMYVIYEDDELGYLQEEVDIDMLNLHDRGFLEGFYLDETPFIGWTSPMASNIHELSLWTIKEEELVPVTFNDEREMTVSTGNIKTSEDKQIQFYRYLNHDPVGYHFYTYDWDEENNNFTEVAHSHLSMDDEEFTNLVVEAWQTDEAFFIKEPEGTSAKSHTFTEDDIALLQEGKLVDESIQLGDSIGKVLQLNGLPAEMSYYSGSPSISYEGNPLTYIKDPKENKQDIIMIIYGGDFVENSLTELRDLFGEPESDEFSMLDEAGVLEYVFGSYALYITYDEDSEKIMQIELIESN